MTTYKVVRFYRDSDHPDHRMLVNNGLSLEEAQAWCSDDDTREEGVWFDGYEEEDTSGSWDTGEVQLWLANDEPSYRAAIACRSAEEMARRFTGMAGPSVDWPLVDWDAVFEHFAEERGEVMGTTGSMGMADAVNDGLVGQRQALVWQLQHNHYPPIHVSFVVVAERAIELANEGDWDAEIEMPNGITKSAGEIVDELHLVPFLDPEAMEPW